MIVKMCIKQEEWCRRLLAQEGVKDEIRSEMGKEKKGKGQSRVKGRKNNVYR